MAKLSQIQLGTTLYDIGTKWENVSKKPNNFLHYGVCGTAADTVAKTVTISNSDSFVLETGAVVAVKFTNSNSASNPTLNVNGTGAKKIVRYGTTAASTGTTTTGWAAGAVQLFIYDGTSWVRDYWSNTTYSSMSVAEGTTGTATTSRVLTAANLKGIINAHAPTKTGKGASGTWGINISGNADSATVSNRSKHLETWYTDKSKTYGSSHPLYAWWETSSECRLKVDNYTVKVNYADSAGTCTSLSTSAGSATKAIYFSGGKPAQCNDTLNHNISGNANTASLWALTGTANTTTGHSDWDGAVGNTNKYTVYDQEWACSSIGNGTGDLRVFLRPGEYTSGDTEVCFAIDGDYYVMGNKVLHAGNYNSYAPTKTGGGASGTWGINVSGNAATATKLATARNIQVNLASTSAASFNGSANITPGVTGTLGVGNGGTGSTTKKGAWSNLIPYYDAPWSTIAEDTGNNWASLGNSSVTWWPDNANGIYNKPSNWGLAFTISAGPSGSQEMHQLWFSQSNGSIYHRGGNGATASSMEASSWAKLWQTGDSVTGAVWNDYAEYRESDCGEFGYVLIEKGDDTLTKTAERLQPFAGVSSDTWGFCQGETERAKTPIAVAGRVLVYPYQDRNNYKPGDCVCAAPGGTVDIMTREEVREWPDRIVGTVSCVPDYEEWGGGEGADRDPVKVNGRIWIKVK